MKAPREPTLKHITIQPFARRQIPPFFHSHLPSRVSSHSVKMGFWGSLVDGAKSAGGWVLNHSGDIAKTVGTVVKVVGVIGPLQVNATTTDDSGTQIKDFFNNFDIASDKLAGIAKSALHRQAAISSGAMGESIEGATKEDSISGTLN